MKPIAQFNLIDAEKAAREWKSNCGPGAIAAALDTTLETIRPYLGDFEKKYYTNPKLMIQILENLGVSWKNCELNWPNHGLVRVQWVGPWTEEGTPLRKRYRHTHWVASIRDDLEVYIFDINCICVGGWVSMREWEDQVIPWLLKKVEPMGYGTWYPTHRLEILTLGQWSGMKK